MACQISGGTYVRSFLFHFVDLVVLVTLMLITDLLALLARLDILDETVEGRPVCHLKTFPVNQLNTNF